MTTNTTKGRTSDPRPPVRPGDWSAIGLTGGRCPVGIVEHVDRDAVHLRLVSAWTGEPIDERAVIRWTDVGGYVVVPAERGQVDHDGYTVMPDEPLWDFQTRWTARHKEAADTEAATALTEHLNATTPYRWRVVHEPITAKLRQLMGEALS